MKNKKGQKNIKQAPQTSFFRTATPLPLTDNTYSIVRINDRLSALMATLDVQDERIIGQLKDIQRKFDAIDKKLNDIQNALLLEDKLL